MKIAAIALMAKNMEKMVAFYREVVGFPLEWDGGDFASAWLDNGTSFYLCARKLMDPESKFSYPEGINGTMEINIGFSSCEEVDREFSRYVTAGATPIQAPTMKPYRVYESFVADVEGNIIELNYMF